MKIAVTTKTFSRNNELVKKLEDVFPEVKLNTEGRKFSKEELIEFLKDVDGAIIGLETIDENVLAHCSELEVIVRYGVGLDNIDLKACREYSVKVEAIKGVNSRSVAELTLSFMLGLIRKIYTTSLQLKRGDWVKSKGYELTGKTVGIIGVGNVGKDLIELLKPFECKILVNDIVDQEEYYERNNLIRSSKEQIFKNADIVTLNLPLTQYTKDLVNEKTISLMKPMSYLINTSRGGIVDEDALYTALKEKRIAGAALDVYAEEPTTNKKLLDLENVICTPHIAGNSEEANLKMGLTAINLLKEHLKNEF